MTAHQCETERKFSRGWIQLPGLMVSSQPSAESREIGFPSQALSRFRNAKAVCAYAGLVPVVRQSGERKSK